MLSYLRFAQFIRRANKSLSQAEADLDAAIDVFLYSALALEALPHDIVHLIKIESEHDSLIGQPVGLPSQLSAVLSIIPDLEQEHAQLRTQIKMMYYLLTGVPLNRGDRLIQDFEFLLLLRHRIVHPKTEVIKVAVGTTPDADGRVRDQLRKAEADERIVRELKTRKLSIIPDEDVMSSWMHHLKSRKAAEWAINVSKDTVKLMHNALPEFGFKKIITALIEQSF